MGYKAYIDNIKSQLADLRISQKQPIEQAARLVANSIMAGGIIQTFGSGHSNIGSTEIVVRAGGLIPTKEIVFPKSGWFETTEGLGTTLMEHVDVRPEDIFVVVSYSGINPLPIEVALAAKKKGNPVVVITSLENSKKLLPKHSSGKHLYELGDVVLDLKGPYGDAVIEVEGLDTKVCATSTVTTAVLVNSMILQALEYMVEEGFEPPVFLSSNLDGAKEYNDALQKKYADRIWVNDTFPSS